ncbi:hypothetical protein AA12717_3453 [Gluconacetobacter sacchari DSM 12717]|uniref:Uncharacterized protein n=1 Tax=Gluconacetobacter sacchari DSM 12717 TaxID=1307940 RepID=A0ABQ0PBF7_9PROT|nr:hypothetical protein AA12717_3453 [Gluconacetobacter sacchari DSM 12717]
MVDDRDDRVALRHGEGAAGQEIVLEIDGQQGVMDGDVDHGGPPLGTVAEQGWHVSDGRAIGDSVPWAGMGRGRRRGGDERDA